ncbi:type II CRISPR-associated endonuclease Cas1 [Stappia sp.]|uniref:type II CRISPR-associated endonuclease Cas1 n=1 Tax=Stappia sp. TaxID=1870903 RepID=UPI0032D91B8B
MQRVVDLSSDGLHVSVTRGFLAVSRAGAEVGRVALDDVLAVIAHAHGLTWSNTVFTRLAERAVPVVVCAQNHAPVACVWPMQGHHLQGARLLAQAEASRPRVKRLWRDVVVAKIRMQGAVLAAHGAEAGAFDTLARKVKSGDPDNVEAQAARRYWQALMGPEFRRDRDAEGANALLNYGYTVLRATLARAICAAGLHPGLGLHHANRGNAFALADDLMEPYRPLVDACVHGLAASGYTQVDPDTKRQLVALTTLDLPSRQGMSPLHVHAARLARDVAAALGAEGADAQRGTKPDLPTPLDPLVLASLGRAREETQ